MNVPYVVPERVRAESGRWDEVRKPCARRTEPRLGRPLPLLRQPIPAVWAPLPRPTHARIVPVWSDLVWPRPNGPHARSLPRPGVDAGHLEAEMPRSRIGTLALGAGADAMTMSLAVLPAPAVSASVVKIEATTVDIGLVALGGPRGAGGGRRCIQLLHLFGRTKRNQTKKRPMGTLHHRRVGVKSRFGDRRQHLQQSRTSMAAPSAARRGLRGAASAARPPRHGSRLHAQAAASSAASRLGTAPRASRACNQISPRPDVYLEHHFGSHGEKRERSRARRTHPRCSFSGNPINTRKTPLCRCG